MQSVIMVTCLLRKANKILCIASSNSVVLLWLRITVAICACILLEPVCVWAAHTSLGSMSHL